ncbi:MAG: WYL domain-containing protein, partial [Caldilineaceae bacterium]|nr:WYL domain-containing protein [Caldilineaceae bacterium]
RPGQPPDLLWHLAIYLSTAAATPLTLQHGRWPSPSTVRALFERMGLDQAPTFQSSRSEKRMPYLAFLHFLAEAAGLVTHARTMQVTPQAWTWLQSTPSQRRRILWHSFEGADIKIATPYDFPWLRPTPQGGLLLRSQLTTLSTHNYEPLPSFITAIQVQDRLGHLADGEDGAQLALLLTQPLHWLGIVDIAERTTPATPSDLGLRLTPTGAWLLGIDGWDAPPDPPAKPAVIRRGAPDTLHFAPDADPNHLARVAAYTTWASPDFPDTAQQLTLDGERIGRAVAAGVPPAQIFHVLEDALARPLSRRQGQLLRKWVKAAQQANVRTVTVLETADAALMGKLRSRRHSRALLGAPLSPTRSELNPEHLSALIDNLAAQDIFVAPPATPPDPSSGAEAVTADAGLVYLALRLLLRLGAHIPLPIAAPYTQIDEQRRALNQDQIAAADSHVQTIIDEIEALLGGYLRLPAWRIQVDGKGVWPRLQRALANEETITIRYWNAEHTTPTERSITPYYIETRRHVRYLHAYCHLRQEERTFRVDRIECVVEEMRGGDEAEGRVIDS